MSVVHFHYSILPDTGDTRRVRNIDKSLCDRMGGEKIEVLFYGISEMSLFRSTQPFTLSANTTRKYCFPLVYRIHWFGELVSSLQLAYVVKRHKAEYVVGEFGSSSRSLKYFRFLCPRVKIFVDFHGAQPEEMLYEDPKIDPSLIAYYRELDFRSCRWSTGIICQSEEMKRHLISKYNAAAKKIAVYKCGVDTNLFHTYTKEQRNILRSELGIGSNAVVFIYSGSVAKWQKVEESTKIFLDYHNYNDNSEYVILTRDIENVLKMIDEMGISAEKEKIHIMTASYGEVPYYLSVADIAFLLRDDVLLNAVASPTKLAEYMSCNLPIITSDVAKKWVLPSICSGLIYVEDEIDLNKKIDNLIQSPINNRQYAIDHLSVEIDEKNIDNLLQSIC